MASVARFEMLPVREVSLDYSNPRIARYVEMYGEHITPAQLHLALNVGSSDQDPDAPTYDSLEQSIRTYGGLIHPILVNREANGRLVVIEGNTRVAIYLRFLSDQTAGTWDHISAMVYDDMPQAEIDAVRLQSHLVGPRPWDPYSKAKYLHHLRDHEHLPMAQIVEFCGNRSREVQVYIRAYEDMEKHYRPRLSSDDQFDETRFSAFVELQNPRIQKAIFDAGFQLGDFAQWIIDRRIHPLNMVRSLPRILANTKSREMFLKYGAQEAAKLLDVPASEDALKDASLEALARELSKRIRAVSYSEVKRLQGDPEGLTAQALQEVRDQLVELCSDVFGEE